MKKTLLLGTALMVGVTGFSQQAKVKVRAGVKAHSKFEARKFSNETPTGTPTSQTANKGNSTNSVNATCYNHVSSSYATAGIFDWLSSGNSSYRNLLTYNSDLNTIAFIHRNSADWKTDGSGSSATTAVGSVMATWWTAGNLASQDSMVLYHTLATPAAGFHSARYPTGTLFNPPGNTNVANAFIAGSGVYTPDGTNFDAGCWYATRKTSAQGSTHALPTNNRNICNVGTAPFGNVGGYQFSNGTYYGTLMNDMQQAGNKIVVCGPLMDASVTVTAGGNFNKGMVIGIGMYSAAGDSIVWHADSIIPGYHIDPATAADPGSGQGYVADLRTRVAFSPDGQTGYAVMLGNLQQVFGTSADSMIAPIVYKTTTGGGTWTPILLGYDWNTGHPEVMRGVGLKVFDPSTPAQNFNFNDDPNGADLTVDANGVLHYVTTVQEVVDDGEWKDTVNYGYGNTVHYDYVNHHPLIWDFMTDGSCWKTLLVDSINTNYIDGTATDTTNKYSRWGLTSPSNSWEAMGAHLTVSRSTDGKIVFYGWGDSDPFGGGPSQTISGLIYNVNPDLVMKAYDVNANTISAKKDITNQDEDVFQPFLSDVSYFDAGKGAWVVPTIYVKDGRLNDPSLSNGAGIVYDVNGGLDYRFNDCGTFSAGEIAANTANIFPDKITSSCNFAYSIKTNNTFAESINNYPNPFSSTTTIAVTLTESKSFNVNVYNAIGTLVYSKKVNGNVGENAVTFDAGALSSGVYYYTVNAGNQQATKKMVIQK